MSHQHHEKSSFAAKDPKAPITALRGKLETLRGVAKVRLHLAGMDLSIRCVSPVLFVASD